MQGFEIYRSTGAPLPEKEITDSRKKNGIIIKKIVMKSKGALKY